MKKNKYLTIVCLLAGTITAYGQNPAKGDAKKGKDVFDQQCGLCHDALSTDMKMAPGLKGLFKRAKLNTTGKPVNDANVLDRVNSGGNGMPPYKDLISDSDKTNLLAYLKTI